MTAELVTTYRQPLPFAILTPKHCPPRTGADSVRDPAEWGEICRSIPRDEIVAIDFETNSLDPTLPGSEIIGTGLVWSTGSLYMHRSRAPQWHDQLLTELLERGQPLIAHNMYFDGQWMWEKFRIMPNIRSCTYALYRHLATEGWIGQKWGLKEAMVDLLLWETPNTAELDNWLVANGWGNSAGGPRKDQMWRAPDYILGKYCILDAEACYLLYTQVLMPAAVRFPELVTYHEQWFCGTHMRVLIEQRGRGMLVDRDKMRVGEQEVRKEIQDLAAQIRNHPISNPHILAWEQLALAPLEQKDIPRYNSRKIPPPPAQFKKNGEVSKGWLRYQEKLAAPPKESKVWQNWQAKLARARNGELEEYVFNPGSADQLRWLFFDRLGYEPLEYTETGLAGVDGESLRHMGSVGKLVADWFTARKEHQYFEGYLELLQNRDTIHAGFQTPGTLTGRLSGRDPNLQNVVKTRRFLEPMHARPGYVWIDSDITSLEVVVCTEMSGDETLMQVFGPAAPAGADIYLHTGVGLPQFSAAIRAAGYDPAKGITPEGTAAAKKICKRERDICKVLYLSSSYGAGARKIHKTLVMQGVNVSLEEVQALHQQYWQLYSGIKRWERELLDEWRANGGYILNGVGRPIGVHRDYTKDIVNRCLTGDTLVRVRGVGYKRLDMCSAHDIIWDGTEWVSCSGLIDQGQRWVIELSGIELTPDHKVWNKYGNWKEAQHTRVEDIQEASAPRASWKEVWGLCNLLVRQVAQAMRETSKNLRRGYLFPRNR